MDCGIILVNECNESQLQADFFVCPSVCLSVCLSVRLSVCLSVRCTLNVR